METLTIGETQNRLHGTDLAMRRTLRHRNVRLPTPNASISSDHSMDSAIEFDTGPASSHSASLMKTHGSRTSRDDESHWRSEREYFVPHSPPYQACDTQRPSLPPLKTVLGESLSSPPQTPGIQGVPFQAVPQEPSIDAGTYKPLSLYPNKKQKIESLLEPPYPRPPQSAYSSPRLPPAPFGPPDRAYHCVRSLHDKHGYTDQYRRRGSSLQPHSAPLPPPIMLTHPFERRQSTTAENAAAERGHLRGAEVREWGVTEQTPGTIALRHDRIVSRTFPPTGPTYATTRRRSQAASYYDNDPWTPSLGPTNPLARMNRVPTPILLGSPEMTARPSMAHEHNMTAHPANSGHTYPPVVKDTPRTPYASNHPPYFLPSGYVFQHGKARKRSNLPKQSTEIMKTWFDQNIMNPYPSEEQKAVFSGATGISMTQVSNWFINHRRRCPELRDKRDRTRESGIECDA